MMSHYNFHNTALCASSEMIAGTAPSSQFHTQTCPIPPTVPRYRELICLERSALIHNTQQTSLCTSGDNDHTDLSTQSAYT